MIWEPTEFDCQVSNVASKAVDPSGQYLTGSPEVLEAFHMMMESEEDLPEFGPTTMESVPALVPLRSPSPATVTGDDFLL